MAPHTILHISYGLTVLATVILLVLWLRDKWIERQARKHRRLAFYTSPFLAHWGEKKQRENFRTGRG